MCVCVCTCCQGKRALNMRSREACACVCVRSREVCLYVCVCVYMLSRESCTFISLGPSQGMYVTVCIIGARQEMVQWKHVHSVARQGSTVQGRTRCKGSVFIHSRGIIVAPRGILCLWTPLGCTNSHPAVCLAPQRYVRMCVVYGKHHKRTGGVSISQVMGIRTHLSG